MPNKLLALDLALVWPCTEVKTAIMIENATNIRTMNRMYEDSDDIL
jgi:hypothetical protein